MMSERIGTIREQFAFTKYAVILSLYCFVILRTLIKFDHSSAETEVKFMKDRSLREHTLLDLIGYAGGRYPG